MEHDSDRGEESGQARGTEDARPQKAEEAATTRFGMESNDTIDVPAIGSGIQNPILDKPEAKSKSEERQLKADKVAEELGNFA
jgi:hypothetical protein